MHGASAVVIERFGMVGETGAREADGLLSVGTSAADGGHDGSAGAASDEGKAFAHPQQQAQEVYLDAGSCGIGVLQAGSTIHVDKQHAAFAKRLEHLPGSRGKLRIDVFDGLAEGAVIAGGPSLELLLLTGLIFFVEQQRDRISELVEHEWNAMVLADMAGGDDDAFAPGCGLMEVAEGKCPHGREGAARHPRVSKVELVVKALAREAADEPARLGGAQGHAQADVVELFDFGEDLILRDRIAGGDDGVAGWRVGVHFAMHEARRLRMRRVAYLAVSKRGSWKALISTTSAPAMRRCLPAAARIVRGPGES